MRGIINNCIYGGICSIAVLIIGLILPRDWFDFSNKLFAERKWEGGFYNKLYINKWKNKLPDMSKYIKLMIAKKLYGQESADDIRRLIEETCVAETAHIALIVLSLGMIAVWQSAGGVICCVLYALGNVPYIMIQRYNRPRLMKMMKRLEKRKYEEQTVM